MDCEDPDCGASFMCSGAADSYRGIPCHGVTAPPRARRQRGQPPPPPNAAIGVLVDPATGLETALTDDAGKVCTLSLPCSAEGLAAIAAVCPPAVPPSQVPNACPAACSEIVDPWYTECRVTAPNDLLAIDVSMNGEFVRFAELCDPRLQAPVYVPPPPPPPPPTTESGRQCTDNEDNDGKPNAWFRSRKVAWGREPSVGPQVMASWTVMTPIAPTTDGVLVARESSRRRFHTVAAMVSLRRRLPDSECSWTPTPRPSLF